MSYLISISFTLVFTSLSAQAQFTPYTKLMRVESMAFAKKIDSLVRKAQSIDDESRFYERVQILKEAATLALTRPNKDNTLVEVMPPIKRELEKDSAYEETILNITKTTIKRAQNADASAESVATQYFILENIMSEIRPCVASHATCKDVLIAIKDANIKTNSKAKSFRKMNGMFKTTSPSVLAERLFKKLVSK